MGVPVVITCNRRQVYFARLRSHTLYDLILWQWISQTAVREKKGEAAKGREEEKERFTVACILASERKFGINLLINAPVCKMQYIYLLELWSGISQRVWQNCCHCPTHHQRLPIEHWFDYTAAESPSDQNQLLMSCSGSFAFSLISAIIKGDINQCYYSIIKMPYVFHSHFMTQPMQIL